MMYFFRQHHLARHPRFLRAGFSLIEIVIGVAMLTTFLLSISAYYRKVLDVSNDTTRHIQSSFLLEEGLEAVRTFRDQSWTAHIATLAPDTTYYFHWNGTQWHPTTTPQVTEGFFTRSFTVAPVYRDASDDIASAGVLDLGARKVTVSVTWQRKGGTLSTTDVAETYITDLFSN